MELAAALCQLGLTTLELAQRSGRMQLTLRRQWDPDTDFSGYGRELALDQIPCERPAVLSDSDSRSKLEALGASAALAELERLMRLGRHELVVLFVHQGLSIELCHHIHSSTLGLRNGFHALRAGGIRRHDPSSPEHDVLRDGLNLARAMSFKCAAAQMPFGGSKTTLRSAPIAPDDARRVGFLGYCIDRGNLMTGPDVGFAPELIDALAARVTPHILCGPSGPLGHTGGPTAEGVLAALHAAAKHRFGSASFAGRRIAIQGLGSVGLALAGRLLEEGASVAASELDPSRRDLARAALPSLELVEPDELFSLECDVLCPCALGGVLDPETIARLRTTMVYGGANNQLAAFTTEEELELAELLAGRGILFQPDWSYTMGGILNGFEEYRHRAASSAVKVRSDIHRLCGDGTAELLRAADGAGKTPTAMAIERYFPLIHPNKH